MTDTSALLELIPAVDRLEVADALGVSPEQLGERALEAVKLYRETRQGTVSSVSKSTLKRGTVEAGGAQ